MRFVPLAALVAVVAVIPLAAEETRPFTAHDLWSMDRLSSPAVSPDGTRIAFAVRSTDFDADRGRTDLWLIGADGTGLRQLTRDEASDHSPVWLPNGDLLFLSGRSGSSQVWRIDPDGGEAAQVTDLPLDLANLVVDRTGKRMAFTIDVFPGCDDLDCTVERLETDAERQASGVVYEQLLVRHWDTWKDGRRSHLFVASVDGSGPLDVTAGLSGDVPSKPFGGAEEVVFAPSGDSIVFTMREGGPSEAWSTDFDLYRVAVDGSSPAVLLTENPAWDTHPVFSPDGTTLAYLAMERPGYESDRLRLVLRDWESGEERVLTEAWDRSIGDFFFAPDGRSIYTTAQDTGEVRLFRIDVTSAEVTRLVDGGHVRSPGLVNLPEGEVRLVFGLDHLRSPVDLYSTALDGTDRRRLTDLNGDRLRSVAFGSYEQFEFDGWNGERVYGWLVEPVDRQPGERYPLAFLIHGGPQGSFDNDFHYRWNPQVYAGAGYAAVMIDFHGSTGYGQAFTDSIHDDWGGKPLVDLQKGLAAVLERYPWIDGERACALGASYGGYMVNWIASQWSEAFDCLVNHDGVFDNRMMYFATEELWFPEWDHGGTYWENPEGHERHNPALHVDEWKSPMLVVQGELDYRVPVTQALGTFTALQRRGIPSRFLYFPDENHWVLSPANGLLWHREVLDWLDAWTAPEDAD